jgi:outer membrane protein OmpA-like peptidoglycan-associated protein
MRKNSLVALQVDRCRKAAVVVASLSFALAGCEAPRASATADEPGIKAQSAGDYVLSRDTPSRDTFQTNQAKLPNDLNVDLDLADAYKRLGRADLAEALYRQAMIYGKNVYPSHTTIERDKGKSIADIACDAIAVVRKSDSCEPLVQHLAQQQPLQPHVKNFKILFDFNRASLTAEGRAVVAQVVETAKTNRVVKIAVTGHTDGVGSDRYNRRLSLSRAEAVKNALVAAGIDAARISVNGVSFHAPLVETARAVAEPENRCAFVDLAAIGPP